MRVIMSEAQIGRLVVAILSASTCLLADGIIVIPEPIHWPPSPRPFPQPRPTSTPLVVEEHLVEVKIQDNIAVTHVEQVFKNPTSLRLEGYYVFPLPRDAAVDRFELEVDGELVPADLLEKEEAQRLYESIIRRNRDPALVELVSDRLFKARIFPFAPGQRRKVAVRYTQILPSEDGLLKYHYPLRIESLSSEAIPRLLIRVEIKSQRDLGPIYSPTHEIKIDRLDRNKVLVQWEAHDQRPDKDFVLYVSRGTGSNWLFFPYRAKGEDGYFLLFYRPAIDESREQLARRLVFVLDSSGSMAGEKLQKAKQTLIYGLQTLREGELFDIISFNTDVEPLFGRLADANQENRTRAVRFIEAVEAKGGTALAPALLQALEEASESQEPVYVILLTDGRPTVGPTNVGEIVKRVETKLPRRCRLFFFGVGYDVNTHLLDQLALIGRGSTEYVTPDEELEQRIASFFARIMEPIVYDVTVRWPEKIKVKKVHPSELSDLFKGQEWVISGCYSGSGDGTVVFEGSAQDRVVRFGLELQFPDHTTEYEFVPRLWAIRRIAYLLDQIRLHGRDQELEKEVVEIARRYGILTPYTAYLLKEHDQQLAAQLKISRQTDRSLDIVVGQAFRHLEQEQVGPGAVGSARSLKVQQTALLPEAAVRYGAVEALRGISADSSPDASISKGGGKDGGVVDVAGLVAYRGGKVFYRVGEEWIDAALLEPLRGSGYPTIRIRFADEEFFVLLKDHPEAREWVSLGDKVSFIINSKVYVVSVD